MKPKPTANPAAMRVAAEADDRSDRTLSAAAAAFLRAERSDDDTAADTALRGLFSALPSPRPSGAFAARVLSAVPLRAPVRRARDLAPRHRWLVAAAALCAALATAYLLPLAVLVLGQVEWGALLAGVGGLFGHLVSGLHGLAPFGRAALSLLHAFWIFLSSPQVLATLVLATSVVALCVRFLTELIHVPRDTAHASS